MFRTINDAGLALIEWCEGCSLQPYLDAVGVPTIGIGHIEGVTMETAPLADRAAAIVVLMRDLRRFEIGVERLLIAGDGLALDDNQFGALVSLSFNEGLGCLTGTHLRRSLRGLKTGTAPIDAFAPVLEWNKITLDRGTEKERKVTSAGLVKRRAAEFALALGKDWKAAGEAALAAFQRAHAGAQINA